MSTISKLLFGQVTNRVHGRKVCKISFNNRTELTVKVNTPAYHALELGCNFFVLYDPASKRISKIAACNQACSSELTVAIENLDNCATDLVNAMKILEVKERDEALRASGVILTGFWAFVNGIQTVNAIFAWEPVNAVAGVALTVGAAVLTKMQYEALTDAQQASIAALKLLQRKLAVYHSTVRRYAPQSMRENVILDSPKFVAIASTLRRIFKNVTVNDFSTNDFNWSVA